MTSSGRYWISRLGLRLALVFMAVALAAVAAVISFGSMSTTRDINQMMAQQRADLTGAIATASKAAYTKHGWHSDDLTPATDLAQHAGAEVQVTSRRGTVIAATQGYVPYGPGQRKVRQIFVDGHDVG